MNLLLLDAEEIGNDGQVHLTDRRAKHLRNILRVTPGRTLRAGVVRGRRYEATVTAVDRQSVTVKLTDDAASAPVDPTTAPRIDLIIALPRPQVLHRVLQFAAAMHVRRIDLVAAWRVEKSFFQSPSLRPETIDRHLRLGAEQGATTWLPDVAVHPRLAPFLSSLEADLAAGTEAADDVRLIAHPDDACLLEDAWHPAWHDRRSRLAIGPEGGWADREVERFSALGFARVGLGPWILRVEAALVSLLSQLDLLRRRDATRAAVC